MSTRKLILTALVCGLVIMFAGGFKLLQIVGDESEVSFLAVGESATLGDMTVSVEAIDQGADATSVTVSIGGVDGGDALEGWRLVSGGEALAPTGAPGEGGCGTTTVAPVRCTIAFPASTGSVTVAYLRAGLRSQWAP